jgi:repressor LexA
MSDDLNPRQAEMLRYMEEYIADHGRPPTTREIGARLNIKSTGHVDYHMRALVAKGYISKQSHTSRGTVIVKPLNPPGVPLRGFIAAGTQLQISDDPQEMLDLGPRYKAHPDAFALQVKGKSMIDDLIDDGDIIVVTPAKEAHNGETVVAMQRTAGDHGAATLKRFYKDRGQVRLEPANSAMKPILVTAREWDRDWEVQAKVIAVIRTF